jgi:hypothetical protein
MQSRAKSLDTGGAIQTAGPERVTRKTGVLPTHL